MNKPEAFCPSCWTPVGEITFRSIICEDKYHEEEQRYFESEEINEKSS